MSQTSRLIQTLKKVLKAQGKTYADIALVLQLSEASVKRLFAQQNFSLQRLDCICQSLGMEISDLVQQMGQDEARISALSAEQEREIVADLELLLVTVCVLNRWDFAQILNFFAIDELRCVQHLAKLDRLKVIDLQVNNRVRLRVSANFKWRENGPIQCFFMDKLQEEFFNSRFDHSQEQLLVLNGMLSPRSNQQFQDKLEQLAQEFDQLNNDDAKLTFKARFGVTVVLAMRPWRYGLFKRFLKREKT
ncbi:MAG: helix-turn-helix transcriptional regulator [Gammaproteobacteria bacterium]|nr:helix-turn-helix transcriptional regulator [Gammaproteobacteria bacterium]